MVLAFRTLNANHRGNTAPVIQWSADLGVGDPWTDNTIEVPDTGGKIDGVSFMVTPEGRFNDVIAIIPKPASGKRFVRLNAIEK